MSLLYRAIWQDDSQDLGALAFRKLEAWVEEKSNGAIQVPSAGTAATTIMRSDALVGLELSIEQTAAELPARYGVIRAKFIETRGDYTRWDTTLRVWPSGASDDSGWIWVDVEAVGDGIERVSPAAPRLVRDLLALGSHPRRDMTDLTPRVTWYRGADSGESLAEELTLLDRDVPIAVFADQHGVAHTLVGSFTLDDIARRASSRVAGIAKIAIADQSAAGQLTEALGADYSIESGGLRVFLPGLDPALPGDFWRHRTIRAERYLRSRDSAGIAIARLVAPASATRRPPPSWDVAAAALRAQQRESSSDAQLLEIAMAENERLEGALSSAQDELELRSEDYDALALDLEEVTDERTRLSAELEHRERRIRHLTQRLAAAGIAGLYADDDTDPVPTSASSVTDAALQAQTWLADRLVLPDSAMRDLDNLDATVNAPSWGQTSWRAFRALHAYASALDAGNDPGSFWTWCANSGHPLAWPATNKKLAMQESESVQANATLREARVLPIDSAVSPDGKIYMGAHIKIAQGGGNLAPRIYFHVDGANARVHVGFFGPHKYMPNTKT